MTEKPAQTAGGGRLSARWQHLQARDKASGYLQARSQLLKLECQWRWTEACLPASVRQLLLGDQRLIQILLERKSVELLLHTLEQRETDPDRRRELLRELSNLQLSTSPAGGNETQPPAGNELPTRSSSNSELSTLSPSSSQPMRCSSSSSTLHVGSPSGSEPSLRRLSHSPSCSEPPFRSTSRSPSCRQPLLDRYEPVVREVAEYAECWDQHKLTELFKELGMSIGMIQKVYNDHPDLKDSGKCLMEKWLSCQLRKQAIKPMIRLLEGMRKIGMGSSADELKKVIEDEGLFELDSVGGVFP